MEEKKKKSDKLYGDSPTVKRGEDGEMSVKKPSDGGAEDPGATMGPIKEEHEAERTSMHKRHEEEQKSMHERHSKDMKEMHKRHEKAGKPETETGEGEIKKTESDKKE